MKKSLVSKTSSCRICKYSKLIPVISLGLSPLANSFLTKNQLKKKELFFSLGTVFCPNCSLLQLSHVVNPNALFKQYLYVSSTSLTFIQHFQEFAKTVAKKFGLRKNDLVVDIGSNDGILLKPFKQLGMRVLGVDPAENVAPIAKAKGIDTIISYFDDKVAKNIVKKNGRAKIITGTNVFAHVNDLDELISAVKILLDQRGVFIIEVPYLVDFLEKNLFDTIYHEHLSYFAVKPLITLFQRFDMKIVNVERVSSHGGSIRVFIKNSVPNLRISNSVYKLLSLEKRMQLENIKTYAKFADKIKKNKVSLVKMLKKLKKDHMTIIGFGAPAKGNTLLNFFSINTNYLDYIIDDNPLKQGLFTPGGHIPVVSEEKLNETNVDYMLILAWNFEKPIMDRFQEFHKKGGKFILPVPKPRII